MKGSLSLRLEEYFRQKAKENKISAIEIARQNNPNNKDELFCQKSDKTVEKVDTKKELSKLSGVSYDTIYKVKEIKSQTPAEILSG